MFAGLLFDEPFVVASEGDAIVRGINDAVGDGDETAAVDVDAVLVGDMDVSVNMDIGDGHEFAAMEEAGPIGGILESESVDPNVFGFAEIDHLRGAPGAFIP